MVRDQDRSAYDDPNHPHLRLRLLRGSSDIRVGPRDRPHPGIPSTRQLIIGQGSLVLRGAAGPSRVMPRWSRQRESSVPRQREHAMSCLRWLHRASPCPAGPQGRRPRPAGGEDDDHRADQPLGPEPRGWMAWMQRRRCRPGPRRLPQRHVPGGARERRRGNSPDAVRRGLTAGDRCPGGGAAGSGAVGGGEGSGTGAGPCADRPDVGRRDPATLASGSGQPSGLPSPFGAGGGQEGPAATRPGAEVAVAAGRYAGQVCPAPAPEHEHADDPGLRPARPPPGPRHRGPRTEVGFCRSPVIA